MMNKALANLTKFLKGYAKSHPKCTKDKISKATAKEFSLTKKRSVFYCDEFAVRFSSAAGQSFSNGVLSLSALKQYDQSPFIVCVVRPEGVELLLANSTFLKKISHSSQQLRIDNVRGTFLGRDILREYEGIDNRPENFDELFDMHAQFTWEENILRLVESTNSIVPTGQRFEPTEKQSSNILQASELANILSKNPEYLQLGKDLAQLVDKNLEAILEAGSIENINLRGNRIEQIITSSGNFHSLEDISRTLTIGHEVKVDIKTKILALTSNPKGYNIDKVLKALALGNTVFSLFFVGINTESKYVVTCLVSILDETILNATRIQFHWAGRNSRGVTQLTGDLSRVFDPDFSETVNVKRAKEFLQRLVELKPIGF
jgi:hypothetical protein